MADRDQKKPPRDNSLNERPSSPKGVRRPSEGGVGQQNSRNPGDADQSPTSRRDCEISI